MKITILPSENLEEFGLHFDQLTPLEFDSLRTILFTLVKEKSVLDSINLEDIGLKKLIEFAGNKN
jgi:hypothetical protein